MDKDEILRWQAELKGQDAEAVLMWVHTNFNGAFTLASSMGAEDQVLLDMICRLDLDIDIFTLDTGRLFPETYDLIAETEKKYGRKINIYFPDFRAVETMVNAHGINLFYQSVEWRKTCCRIRKLEPLARALAGRTGWICGLRQEQSISRQYIENLDWDSTHQLAKLNPLRDWSEAQVWAYIKKYQVPYNPLHDRNFISIGCACCTRAVRAGEEARAGRWWWENGPHKECGLHLPAKKDSNELKKKQETKQDG